MAIFKRSTLKDKGLTDDQIDYVMNEAGRVFAGYTPSSEVQSRIDAAVEEAKSKLPVNIPVSDTDEYKSLLAENHKIKSLQGDEFEAVKKPYRDIIWDKLDHGDKRKPYAEQLTALSETLPDLFVQREEKQTEPAKPQFGASVQGQMPQGQSKPTLESLWFGKK